MGLIDLLKRVFYIRHFTTSFLSISSKSDEHLYIIHQNQGSRNLFSTIAEIKKQGILLFGCVGFRHGIDLSEREENEAVCFKYHNIDYSVSLFPILHLEHNVCKLSSVVSPPFDHGMIWSICNSTAGSFAGDAPQAQHLKLSLFST